MLKQHFCQIPMVVFVYLMKNVFPCTVRESYFRNVSGDLRLFEELTLQHFRQLFHLCYSSHLFLVILWLSVAVQSCVD